MASSLYEAHRGGRRGGPRKDSTHPAHSMLDKFYSHWKFTFLLAAALLVIGTRLAMSENAAEEVALDLFGVFLLGIGLLTLCENRRHRLAALILGCLEAICGQLYLAVLVAGLVGMRGARSEAPAQGPSE